MNKYNIQTEFFSAQEAADYLGMKLSYLYKLNHLGEIPFYKPNGGRVYYKKSDLKEWISTRNNFENEFKGVTDKWNI